VKARFSSIPGAEAKVLWETRTVPVKDGLMDDSFRPFAVHVYKW
jgi:hypothetical protein